MTTKPTDGPTDGPTNEPASERDRHIHPFQRSVRPSDDKYGRSKVPLAIALGVIFFTAFVWISVSSLNGDSEDTTSPAPTTATTTSTTAPSSPSTAPADVADMDDWITATNNGGRSDLEGPAEALAVATAESDFDQLLIDCKNLEGAVARSQDVEAMPDEELQVLWDGYLHDLWAASTLCTEGIERPSSWLMSLAGDQIQAAVSAQIVLDNALAES